jgi:deoxyribodipyrimidine photo-lyase
MKEPIVIFWFRRDLRLYDNAGLYHALRSGSKVLPIFIFDTDILSGLDKKDKRIDFIHQALLALQSDLKTYNSTLHVLYGKPIDCWKELVKEYNISAVYTNHDYEPYARKRDEEVRSFLNDSGIEFFSYKDQVIFEKNEVLKDNGEPYTVYTPFSKKWKAKLNDFYLKSYPIEKHTNNFLKQKSKSILSLRDIGFEKTGIEYESPKLDKSIARHYHETRDIPGIEKSTTRLSVHLRFGTISIRRLVKEAKELNEKLLNELIWREFYQMILWHFPYEATESFKLDYDRIKWRNNEAEFKRWCEGKTGFPIVDAGMRELNETGYMHNRVRLITASFLCKDLLIDWRWGEAYFAEKLLDYDMASNVGNWQWAAGSGCDAAPYFRVFNPHTQTEKFDPDLKYIRKWIPELDTNEYPLPIVEHNAARKRCIEVYRRALKQ